MATDHRLLSRIRGEYREMPGLRLTFTQACRLWQLDDATCHKVLDTLIVERFLQRTPDGSYTVFAVGRPAAAKASVRPHRQPASRRQRA
jgi:DNA-binding IclR family transcriptional regulator